MAKREMLINYVGGEESRIAIVEDGRLEELYQERARDESHVGNIYKGRVTNVEPAIQAAFIDFGLERNGFLHISDLHPMYFPGDSREDTERVGKKTPRRDRPPIQRCLKRGQEMLVQVLKEGIGTKGPTLTSYLSIPGRFVVMMPFMERLGVSRKVEDDDERRVMRKMLDELKPPKEFGFIVRTAGMGRTKTDLKRDLAYLQRLWKAIDRRKKKVRVGELYTESDLVIRTLRDVFSSDIDRVVIDDLEAAKRARDFLAISNPRSSSQVLVYDDPIPLFHRYGVEEQIENIHAREVPLPCGGSLVIESTEALVAIDVNSGKSRASSDAEQTAFRTNQEATDEICRQLRLRDLGGVVVCDLIDMRHAKNRRAIEQRFRDHLKNDRARTKVLAISQLGILEMTRQRMRPSLQKSVYSVCHHCDGMGETKSPESVVLDVMRRLALVMHRPEVARVELTVSPDVAFLVLNRKRQELVALEQAYDTPVMVRVTQAGRIDGIGILALDARGSEVTPSLEKLKEPALESVEKLWPQRKGKDAEAEEPEEPEADESEDVEEAAEEQPAAEKKSKRRRRRGRKSDKKSEEEAESKPDDAQAGEEDTKATSEAEQAATRSEAEAEGADGEAPKRKRRRRRGGKRRGKGDKAAEDTGSAADETKQKGPDGGGAASGDKQDGSSDQASGDSAKKSGSDDAKRSSKRRSRRGGKKSRSKSSASKQDDADGGGSRSGSAGGSGSSGGSGSAGGSGSGYSNPLLTAGEKSG